MFHLLTAYLELLSSFCHYDEFGHPYPAVLTSCVLLLFLIYLLIVFIFNDSLQTNLKIYRICFIC